MHPARNKQYGFTLVEMIVVMVITGIIGGMVAIFIRAPVQGYMDSARRAEMTDIADTALRRLGRDIRTAVPNSIRVANCGGTPTCVEFLPTSDGGRYRANSVGGSGGCGVDGDDLSFTTADSCFQIVGSPITFVAGDQIVIGSTQSEGNPPYRDPTEAACGVAATTTCIRRAIAAAGVGVDRQEVRMTPTFALPFFAEVDGQRFDVVPGDQQAVTYACIGTLGALDPVSNDGQARLVRYWHYGFNSPSQVAPPLAGAGSGSAILADKVSACEITYAPVNQRNGLVAIRLGITRGGESISLYHTIHVNNVP